MKAILNVIWLLFGGIWLALGYVLAGIVCCLLIVTIPFGIASFRIASYALWPFGRTVIDSGRGTGVLPTLGNVIWLVLAGVWIAIGHVLTAIPMFVSIIGIPLGIANLKMIPISLVPLGKRIVPTSGPGLVPYNSPTPYATYSGSPGKGRYGR
ncbi:YccF domain-containing protein [Arthrobacter luteolus]|uniref:YccF domain-containing protein n=1 Tax=Arthrobacter luteolus TaxID=98672 RepID=UPI0009FB0A51|nr:YccF domain-containing protein [Arthrobacter luteolus]